MDGCRPRRTTRTFLSLSSIFLMICFVVLGFTGPGCREQSSVEIDRNIVPETIITGAPGDSLTSFYRVHLYWGGFDPDGEVVGYEWAITDSLPERDDIIYSYTTRTDSIFRFSVLENSEILGHRFYIRAVDNDGRRDPTPAFTFFAARDVCSPQVNFLRAEGISPDGTERKTIVSTNQITPTDTIPAGWDVVFSWEGTDCDIALDSRGNEVEVGSISKYFYRLAPRELNDLGGTLADTTKTYSGDDLSSGSYSLSVRAVDDAGFAGLDPAVRSFVWNQDATCHFTKALEPGASDSSFVFYADSSPGVNDDLSTYVVYSAGDTIPIAADGVELFAEVRGFDPDDRVGDGAPAEYQIRLVDDSGRWVNAPDRTFRARGIYTDRQGYKLICRAYDTEKRWGEPDTIPFFVNIAPYFVSSGGPAGDDFVQSPLPGETIQVAAGDSSMVLKFAAFDEDRASSNPQRQKLEWRYKFDSYPESLGGTGGETFFRPSGAWIEGFAFGTFQNLDRSDIPVTLESNAPYVSGDYTLAIQVREFRNGTTLGKRIATRRVEFRIEVQ